MKFIKLILLMATLCPILSCDSEREFAKTDSLMTRSESMDYHMIGGNGYVVLLKSQGTSSEAIFVLYTQSKHLFQQNLKLHAVREVFNGLIIELVSGKTIRWSVGPDVTAHYSGYGLTKVSGPEVYPFFYGNGGPLSDPDVEEVSCKCKANTDKSNCDHGGKGSTECTIEHGGTLVGSGIQMKCGVKCETGYYACCKNL
ncbi:MAG: hypothetical protein IPM92_16160 [Saprospiraceae bacterium]|nr:hypothetical protein [Saprospiraceae bacterium]